MDSKFGNPSPSKYYCASCNYNFYCLIFHHRENLSCQIMHASIWYLKGERLKITGENFVLKSAWHCFVISPSFILIRLEAAWYIAEALVFENRVDSGKKYSPFGQNCPTVRNIKISFYSSAFELCVQDIKAHGFSTESNPCKTIASFASWQSMIQWTLFVSFPFEMLFLPLAIHLVTFWIPRDLTFRKLEFK